MSTAQAIDFREFASELATLVIDVVRDSPARLGVEIKADGSPVTAIDVAVETAVRARIESAYPDHGVLGEESPPTNPDAEWLWVVDPIDGTSQFAAGLPNYGSLIALCQRGIPKLGVICQPDTRDVYIGVSGAGTWLNGAAVSAVRTTALAETNLCITDPDAYDDRLRRGIQRLRDAAHWHLYEGGCLSFGGLAAGRIGVSVYGSNLENFDICALVPVVQGAGGVITDWRGGDLTVASKGEIVASATPELHAEVLALLNGE